MTERYDLDTELIRRGQQRAPLRDRGPAGLKLWRRFLCFLFGHTGLVCERCDAGQHYR